MLFILCVAFVFGLLFGSFLNVCIRRLPLDESIVTPRSHCPACKHPLAASDNIPLLSYALLRGRCRHCNAAIGWQYPAVEFATGLWFALSFLASAQLYAGFHATGGIATHNGIPDALLQSFVHGTSLAALGCLLIALLVTDWQTFLLPDELTLGGTFLGMLLAATESFFLPFSRVQQMFTPEEQFIAEHAAAALGGFLLLYLIGALYHRVRKRRGMGLGDAKLLALIGSFLGFAFTGLALFLGIVFAMLYAAVLLVRRRAQGSTRLPFGSFLALGGLIAAIFGNRIIDAYLLLFH